MRSSPPPPKKKFKNFSQNLFPFIEKQFEGAGKKGPFLI